jgi:uncharacterized protein YbjT (DUF2867 family)
MTRDPASLDLDPWRSQVEVVQADVLDPGSLSAALEGCDYAYYLVHSMAGSSSFSEHDRAGAENTRRAAEEHNLKRIVYLGGLGEEDSRLSSHLRSRHEVGEVLAAGPTSITELRAAVIIGSGSVSFEMVRYLTEVLPVMTTPRWVRTRCQPIAVDDVLSLLVRVITEGIDDRVIEIGGPDVLTYEQMMHIYAEEAGLRRRLIIPVPVLSPGLSSLWIGLVTPLPPSIARPLVDGLKNEVVVRDGRRMSQLLPSPIPYREAVRRALARYEEGSVETRWSDAANSPALPIPSDPEWAGGSLLTDTRRITSAASAEDLFWAVTRIGGEVGYYTFNWAWTLRGWLDQIAGGIGLRRGRRHPAELRPGEALDFWRVRQVLPNRRLLLQAEMKVPGEAFLEWSIEPGDGRRTFTQVAYFAPRGLWGRLYWYGLYPAHVAIFGRMARKIAQAAERRMSTAL